MVAPTLTLEQYQYNDDGVLLNGPSTLPFVDVESVDGLDMPDFRQSMHDREGVDGGYVEAAYLTSRTVTIEGTVYASPTNLESYLDSLKANFAPTTSDKPLYFQTDSAASPMRVVFGKSLGFRYPKNTDRRLGIVKFQVQVMCGDPRIYDATPVNVSNAWGAGLLTATLIGNRTSPGTLTITGPVTSATVTHAVTGTVFSFPGYTISAGQSVVINLGNRSVIQNGTTNVRNKMAITGNWYELVPSGNGFTKGGSGTTGATTLAVSARSAYQ